MQNINEVINMDSYSEDDSIREAANCLIAYLKVHGEHTNTFSILQFLADETIERLDQSKSCKFNNLAIQDAVKGGMRGDPSAWISPIWNKLVNEVMPSREKGLESFAASNGFKYYPGIHKQESPGGSGNQSLYSIEAKRVSASELNQSIFNSSVKADISYIPAIEISPSWWAKWLFNQNNSATGWRKGVYIFFPIIWIVFMLLGCLLIWYILSKNKNPVTSQDLMVIIFAFGALYYCWQALRKWLQLVEDRIVMAPDHLLSWGEFNVSLELDRVSGENKKRITKILRLVKYASQCPICEAVIQLDKGEPDFPRRIVGRCQESPREHVYSFDRITKTGMRLR